MSILDIEYQNKINELKNKNFLNKVFLEKSLEFKEVMDDFILIKRVSDSFFIDLYKKNFSDILDFEFDNNFKYSDEYIYDLEQRIQNLETSKYDRLLDYMIIKTSDLNSKYYGSILNFILNLFGEINDNLVLIKRIKNIWKNKYKNEYPNFSDFKNSNEFEKITSSLIKEKQNKIDFDNDDKSFIYNFFIFTSKESDFFIKDLTSDNLDSFLFDNQKEFYKKNGNIMLEGIKNNIISYN